ncbi:MAG TPA: hypothetical protein VF461_24585 [Gemmatimonadaceae bacterium]
MISLTPPLYEQLRRDTLRNRTLAWFAARSYRVAALRGAAFALGITLVQFLVRELDRAMPGPAPEPPITLRWLMVDGLIEVLLFALLMCLATASARGLIRLYVRTRTGRGLT